MAQTASTGFKFTKCLYGLEHAATMRYLIAGSATLKIGDLVRVNTSGLLVRCASTEAAAGVLDGIVDHDGGNIFGPNAVGTGGATLTPDDTVVTSSTNATDATRNIKGDVIIDPAGICLFYNDADGDFAQTNLYQMFDVANGNQVTSGSANDSNGQVQLMELDPDGDGDLSKGLFRLHENQFGMGIDTGTAKVAA